MTDFGEKRILVSMPFLRRIRDQSWEDERSETGGQEKARGKCCF
jgi:hypothetical protein